MEICPECKTEMIEEEKNHFRCPNCDFTRWVIPMNVKQLRKLSRDAYLDARHLNRGSGGLNL